MDPANTFNSNLQTEVSCDNLYNIKLQTKRNQRQPSRATARHCFIFQAVQLQATVYNQKKLPLD